MLLDIVNDGMWKLDGGRLFGETPKEVWENWVVTDRRNCVTLALNCLLIQAAGEKVLVNTGIGSFFQDSTTMPSLVPSRLRKELKALGVKPREISMVILSDLRFINAGGCIRVERTGNIVPTFPRAQYIVQRDALGEALGEFSKPSGERSLWHPDPGTIVSPLADRGQLLVIDGDREILPGINVRKTSGFTRGHQIVLVRDGGEHVAFLGNVVPTRSHLNSEARIPVFARHPETAVKEKRQILDEAVAKGWLVVFPWEPTTPAGYMHEVRDPEGLGMRTIAFVPVDLSATRRPALVS